ncbi:hypothetical protein ZWY2020_032831 [Hordeum vulgare]|nr:hypothetical protein ZWY2020_032831 [Hordeum vulgare]
MPATSGHNDSLSTLNDELGFCCSQSIGVKDLVQKLAKLVEEEYHVTVDPSVKVFFMILYQNLLCPGPAVHLGRVGAIVENMDYAAMAQMDFCQLVVDELQASGNIVYYRPPARLCGSFDAGPIIHAVFCELICSHLPVCDVEPPPTRGFTTRQMFDNRSYSKWTFVGTQKNEEIDELLVKVLKLTKELPTFGDRLRTVAEFFPAGHGPREDDIVGFDVGLHGGCTSLSESQGSQGVMKDCAIEISPDNSGSLVVDDLNMDVASGPDGGKVAPPVSSNEPSVEDWKAEYIFLPLFNPLNMLYYGDMPAEIRDLIESLGLTSPSQS